MSKKAFLVGINRYKMPGSDLKGCVNDVTNVRDVLLKYFGFRAKPISPGPDRTNLLHPFCALCALCESSKTFR